MPIKYTCPCPPWNGSLVHLFAFFFLFSLFSFTLELFNLLTKGGSETFWKKVSIYFLVHNNKGQSINSTRI